MFWLTRTTVRNGENEPTYRYNCQPLLSVSGESLDFPEGQSHTSAILTHSTEAEGAEPRI